MELTSVRIDKPDDANLILGQAHFIKTVEDVHEALAGSSPHLRFGLAFCEASGARLVRRSGNDAELVEAATRAAVAIGAGHCFVVLLRDGFPLNVLNQLKLVPEVCRLYCATANDLEVLVAETPRAAASSASWTASRRSASRPPMTSEPGATSSARSATSSETRRHAIRRHSRTTVFPAQKPGIARLSRGSRGSTLGVHDAFIQGERSCSRAHPSPPPTPTSWASRSRPNRKSRPPTRQPLLVAKGMTKRFGRVQALVDADLELYPGEVVALVGDNGAGKSTLIKAIAGVQPADEGEIWIDGKRVHIRNASDAYKLGIATVYQDLALCDNLDVVANLFLGGEKLTRLGHTLDEQAMEHKTLELLDSLGVTSMASVRARVGSLSGGQRQAVAIARSLLGQPRIVILDEPTAALGVVQTAQVLELIHRLRAHGLAVVVISHNLENIYSVADRIVVLRLGHVEASFDRRTTPRQEVVAAITGAAGQPVA